MALSIEDTRVYINCSICAGDRCIQCIRLIEDKLHSAMSPVYVYVAVLSDADLDTREIGAVGNAIS